MKVRDIAKLVAEEFQVSVEDLYSKNRRACLPRSVAWYLARRNTAARVTNIGALFGCDHSSVIQGCGRITTALTEDRSLAARVKKLEQILESEAGDIVCKLKTDLAAATVRETFLRQQLEIANSDPLEPLVARYLEAHERLQVDLYTRSEQVARREVDHAF